ncbi:MAG TPA: hypothetical protein VMX16_09640 [Terriglobia bacterium]|nr:hypothetical protein [Terriglobia bacterium]
MRLILSPQQRILFLMAIVLVLFVLWTRLLARMNATRGRSRDPAMRPQTGAENRAQSRLFPRWKRYLAAILLGNAAYFFLYPYLPAAAQHRSLLDLGTLVDLWLCVVFYGFIGLGISWVRRRPK